MPTRTIPDGTPGYLSDLAIQDLIWRRDRSSQITMRHLEEIIIGMHRHAQALDSETQALKGEVASLRLRVGELQQVVEGDADGRG